MADVDELVWCAAGDGVGISYTATFDPADSLEDGPRDPESTPASWTVVESSGNFSDKSGGVDDEFGQSYYSEKKQWLIWAYNNGVLDWVEGSQGVGIYQEINGTAFAFSDTIDISLQGASMLASASLAVILLVS